jgi:hypothetical protein
MKVIRPFKTSVTIFQSTRRKIHETYILEHLSEKLKSHIAVTPQDGGCRFLRNANNFCHFIRWNIPVFFLVTTVRTSNFHFNKTNKRTNFANLFCQKSSTCFGQFLYPSSGVFHCTFGTGICHQTCMTYTSAECTVENWWWTEELSETCSFLTK